MWYTFVSWTNMVSYNLGIWLFAMRYWTLSLILSKTLAHENPDQYTKNLEKFTNIGGFCVILFSTGFQFLAYYGLLSKFAGICSTILWTVSFLFLMDGLRRIKKVMQSLTEAVLIYNAFVFYAVTSMLAIVGQIPIIYIIFAREPTTVTYATITILSNCIVFLF